MQQTMICEIHQIPALQSNDNKNNKPNIYCQICIKIKNSSIQPNPQTNNFSHSQIHFKQSTNLMNQLLVEIEENVANIQQVIEKFNSITTQKMIVIKEKYDILKAFSMQLEYSNEQIKAETTVILDNIEQIRRATHDELVTLQSGSGTDKIQSIINELSNDRVEEEQNNLDKIQLVKKSLFNKLSDKKHSCSGKSSKHWSIEASLNQKEWCYALAFNDDSTTLIAGSENNIKVFDVQQNCIKEKQQLKVYQNIVYCLKFLSKSKQFFSASCDGVIILWKLDQNNQWINSQIFKDHKDCIWSLTVNQVENILISTSSDCFVKFWYQINDVWNCSQSIDCQNQVLSASLSDEENKLITYVLYSFIFVIQFSSNQWKVIQKISVAQGHRLCFINQNQFVFQTLEKQNFLVYIYDNSDSTFKVSKKICLQKSQQSDEYCLFPINFIKKRDQLVVKHGQQINVIKLQQDGTFRLEKSLLFDTNILFGCICNEGTFLATWDNKQKEIQIRKIVK